MNHIRGKVSCSHNTLQLPLSGLHCQHYKGVFVRLAHTTFFLIRGKHITTHGILRLELLLEVVRAQQHHFRVFREALVSRQVPHSLVRESWHRHHLSRREAKY